MRFANLVVFVAFAGDIAFALGDGLGDETQNSCYYTAYERLVEHRFDFNADISCSNCLTFDHKTHTSLE